MDDWYGVLQVAPGADPDVIATAHRWLAERYSPQNDPSEEAAEKLRQVNAAYAVLGDAERRAAYDAERGITPPAPEPSVAPAEPVAAAEPAAVARPSRAASVMLGVVVGVTFVVALAVAITAALTSDNGADYNANRGDGDYDLEHMALTESDMPQGVVFVGAGEVDSVRRWATSFFDVPTEEIDEQELAAKVAQIEAQGWIRNSIAEGGNPGFGKILGVKSVSTLYNNEEAAQESTTRFACGLPIELSEQLEEFIVPDIADQAVGFMHRRPLTDEFGDTVITFVDTTVCFRTGRIVHAVQQTSIDGIQDIGGSIRTAYVLLDHVNDAYEGNVPADEEDEDG